MDRLLNLIYLKLYPERPSPFHFPFLVKVGIDPYHEDQDRFRSPIRYFNKKNIKIKLIDKNNNLMVIWLTVYDLNNLRSDINGGAVPWLHGLSRID